VERIFHRPDGGRAQKRSGNVLGPRQTHCDKCAELTSGRWLRTIGGDEAQVLGVVVSVETVCAEGILAGRSAGTSKRMNMRSSPFFSRRKARDTSLHGQLHAAHEIVEARVGAQAVQPGIDLYQGESCRALLVCLLQPEERLLLVFQAGMN
jgi:hypothetical protein